jgi:hypothetical protein
MTLIAIALIVLAGNPVEPNPHEGDPLGIAIYRDSPTESVEQVEESALPQSAVWMDSVEEWRPLVAGHFPPEAVDTALCLMERESAGNPNAQNPSSGASGLFQVLPSWADNFGFRPVDLFVPEHNVWVARQLYDDGGWNHWSPWLRGECR